MRDPNLSDPFSLSGQTTTSLPCQGSIVARKCRPSFSRPRWISLQPRLGASPGAPGTRLLAVSVNEAPSVMIPSPDNGHALIVGGQDGRASLRGRQGSNLDRVDHRMLEERLATPDRRSSDRLEAERPRIRAWSS